MPDIDSASMDMLSSETANHINIMRVCCRTPINSDESEEE